MDYYKVLLTSEIKSFVFHFFLDCCCVLLPSYLIYFRLILSSDFVYDISMVDRNHSDQVMGFLFFMNCSKTLFSTKYRTMYFSPPVPLCEIMKHLYTSILLNITTSLTCMFFPKPGCLHFVLFPPFEVVHVFLCMLVKII